MEETSGFGALSSFILERLIKHISVGETLLNEAMQYSIVDLSLEISRLLNSGLELERVLKSFDLENPRKIADRIHETAHCIYPDDRAHQILGMRGKILSKLPQPSPLIFGLVLVGGGVQQVPTVECMTAHLPKDRKPTIEELRQAWEACQG